jgi:putative regulator of septum formation
LRSWWGAGVFLIYVLFLIVSGIAMLVMASVNSGQTAGRRAWYVVFGAGFTLYGLYLLLFFRGGHYLVFFYAFILPVLMTVRFFRDRSAFRAKQQAAALQGPTPGYAQPPGFGQPPGGGDIQDAAATAAETAGLAPGGAHTPTGPGDTGSGPQMTVGDIGASPWAVGTPLPSEMTGGFPLPADVTGAEPSPRHRGAAVLTIVAVSVVAAVAATAIVLGKTSAHKPIATQAPTRKSAPGGAPVPVAQPLLIDQLQSGDCLQGPPDVNTAKWWPYVVVAVPCSEKHLAEVYFFSANYWPAAMAFPGHATIIHQAKTECRKAFQAYDGGPSAASQYFFRDISPWDRVNWSSGDRLLLCTAYARGSHYRRGVPLYTSIGGSNG